MPEFFPLVDIRNMHLDGLHAAAGDTVAQGDADVGVTTGIDDKKFYAVVGPLRDRIDEFTFVVGLEEARLGARSFRVRGDEFFKVSKRLLAVDLRLALAEPIEVRSVDDADFHRQSLAGGHGWLKKQSGATATKKGDLSGRPGSPLGVLTYFKI